MDKKNVQKSNRRNLFAKIRRALGNLRNFFRTKNPRPWWCEKTRKATFAKCS